LAAGAAWDHLLPCTEFARQLDRVDLWVTDDAVHREHVRKLVGAILAAAADR
jgi:hypothetical protein